MAQFRGPTGGVFQRRANAEPSLGDKYWIVAILVLAAVLRAVNLDASLWYDEVVTLVSYMDVPTADLFSVYQNLNNHIFFTIQAQVTTGLFGDTAWALRLPAVLMGLASIWALWRLSFDVAGPWQARFAALLMAVSYHHIWFSQNARGYTGLLFFALLGTWLLVRALRRPGWGIWCGYGLCIAAAMYTHLSAVFFFAAQGIGYALVVGWQALSGGLANEREAISKRVLMPAVGCGLGIGIVAALYAPLVGQMVETFSEVATAPESKAAAESIAQWDSPLWMLSEVASSLGPELALLVPIVAAVAVIGGFGLRRGFDGVVPLTLALHIPLTVALLVAFGFRVWPRYFLIDLGLICLLIISGAFYISRWASFFVGDRPYKYASLFAVLACAGGIAASTVILPKNYLYPKQDYLGAAAYVEANKAPGAVVMTIGLGSMPFQEHFAPNWVRVDTLEEFEEADRPATEVWAVYTFPKVVEHRHADIFAAMKPRFQKAKYLHGTLNDAGIVILKAEGGAAK